MTAPEVQRQLEALDREITQREALRALQLKLRLKFLLDETADGRDTVRQIEQGIRASEGYLPAVADLVGRPGLVRTEHDLLRLRERRAAWLEQLPSADERTRAAQRAAERADEIHTMASG